MKRRTRYIVPALIAVMIVATLGVSIAIRAQNGHIEPETNEEVIHRVSLMTVEQGLNQTFTVNADVAVGQSASLTPERRAKIDQILVKPGDQVNEGDVLAVLHSESLDSSLLNAQIMYGNALSQFSTTEQVSRNTVESERVRLQTAEVDLANTLKQNQLQTEESLATLENTKRSHELSVAEAELALTTAEKKLVSTKQLGSSNVLVANTSLQNAIRTLKTSILSGIHTSNELVEVDNHYRGKANLYKNLLGARSQASLRRAELALEKAIASYKAHEETYVSTKIMAEDADMAFDEMLVLLNYSVPQRELTQAIIDSYLASIGTTLTTVRGGIASLESAQSSIVATRISNDANLVAAEQEVERAKASLESARRVAPDGRSQIIVTAEVQHARLVASLESAEDAARSRVESAMLAYNNAQKSSELSNLSARTSFQSAKDALTQLQISQRDLTITAPFTGVVRSVPAKLGDEVNAGTVVAELENPATLLVVAELSTENAKTIRVGDEVRIGTGTGVIDAISASSDPVTKTHRVEIIPNDPALTVGTFVSVEFRMSDGFNENFVYLPVRVVHLSPDENFVWTIQDGKTKKTAIILGEVSGDRVEVTNGLAPGTQIISSGGRILEEEGIPVEVVEEV